MSSMRERAARAAAKVSTTTVQDGITFAVIDPYCTDSVAEKAAQIMLGVSEVKATAPRVYVTVEDFNILISRMFQ